MPQARFDGMLSVMGRLSHKAHSRKAAWNKAAKARLVSLFLYEARGDFKD